VGSTKRHLGSNRPIIWPRLGARPSVSEIGRVVSLRLVDGLGHLSCQSLCAGNRELSRAALPDPGRMTGASRLIVVGGKPARKTASTSNLLGRFGSTGLGGASLVVGVVFGVHTNCGNAKVLGTSHGGGSLGPLAEHTSSARATGLLRNDHSTRGSCRTIVRFACPKSDCPKHCPEISSRTASFVAN